MLADSEEKSGCAQSLTVGECNQPLVTAGNNRLGGDAAENLATFFFGAAEQCCIQDTARERKRREGKCGLDQLVAGREAYDANGSSAKLARRNASLMEIGGGLGTEKLAADLIVRAAFSFDQHDVSTRGGEAQGGHCAGRSAADDETIDELIGGANPRRGCGGHCGLLLATQRRAGLNSRMETAPEPRPAAAQILSQSCRTKARAMDAGLSYCTKGCRRASLAKKRRK